MLFRKKPVIVKAWEFDGSWESVRELVENESNVVWSARGNGSYVSIKTLEGTMEATKGDWIIRGTAGELYPCKPDIFMSIYERVE